MDAAFSDRSREVSPERPFNGVWVASTQATLKYLLAEQTSVRHRKDETATERFDVEAWQ